jgi:hypothetical protein
MTPSSIHHANRNASMAAGFLLAAALVIAIGVFAYRGARMAEPAAGVNAITRELLHHAVPGEPLQNPPRQLVRPRTSGREPG